MLLQSTDLKREVGQIPDGILREKQVLSRVVTQPLYQPVSDVALILWRF